MTTAAVRKLPLRDRVMGRLLLSQGARMASVANILGTGLGVVADLRRPFRDAPRADPEDLARRQFLHELGYADEAAWQACRSEAIVALARRFPRQEAEDQAHLRPMIGALNASIADEVFAGLETYHA